jgi:Holliday junction resolvasome RuvABC DNA-binding subunit
MKNTLKIEIETDDGQILWKHYRFPSWKLSVEWAARFFGLLERIFKQGKSAIKQQDEPEPKIEQNAAMRAEAEGVLTSLGVKKKQIKKLLDKAGPCQDTEEMVRKCLHTA